MPQHQQLPVVRNFVVGKSRIQCVDCVLSEVTACDSVIDIGYELIVLGVVGSRCRFCVGMSGVILTGVGVITVNPCAVNECRTGQNTVTVVVTECRDNCLCNDDFAADRAVTARCLTGGLAGSVNSCVGNFGVSECVNIRINIAVAADGAGMCGVTLSDTSRSGYNINIGMSAGCRNGSCFKNSMADRTFLMLRSAGCAACFAVSNPVGRSVSDHVGINLCTAEFCVTYRAVNYGFIRALCGAGCRNNIFLNSRCRGMILHGNFCLSDKDLAADGALLTFGKTCLCAGSFYCREDFFGVSNHFGLSCFNVACVVSADSLFRAFLGAGGGVYYCPLAPCVTLCRNNCLSNDYGVAGCAVASLGKTGGLAGCRNSSVRNNVCVVGGVDRKRYNLGCAAAARHGDGAFRYAGSRSLCALNFCCVVMFARCRDCLTLCGKYFLTYCAVGYKVVRTVGAAGGFDSVLFSCGGGVTGGRSSVSDCIGYIATVALRCLCSVGCAGCIVIGNIVCEAMAELVDCLCFSADFCVTY